MSAFLSWKPEILSRARMLNISAHVSTARTNSFLTTPTISRHYHSTKIKNSKQNSSSSNMKHQKRKKKSNNAITRFTKRQVMYEKPSKYKQNKIHHEQRKKKVTSTLQYVKDKISEQFKMHITRWTTDRLHLRKGPVMDEKWFAWNIFLACLPGLFIALLCESYQSEMKEFYAEMRKQKKEQYLKEKGGRGGGVEFMFDKIMKEDKNTIKRTINSEQSNEKQSENTDEEHLSSPEEAKIEMLLQRIEELERRTAYDRSDEYVPKSGIQTRIEERMQNLYNQQIEEKLSQEEQEEEEDDESTDTFFMVWKQVRSFLYPNENNGKAKDSYDEIISYWDSLHQDFSKKIKEVIEYGQNNGAISLEKGMTKLKTWLSERKEDEISTAETNDKKDINTPTE